MKLRILSLAVLIGAGLSLPATATDGEDCSLGEALGSGTLTLKQRYRLEGVDVDGVSSDALASTLRSALGYQTGTFHQFSATVEFEDITPIGNDDYNSTTNGRTRFPVVADPNTTEVNQVFLDYTGVKEWTFRVGRQRILLDNHRYVGNVGWRQNEQTFDAATASGNVRGFGIYYGYVDNVNRVTGDDNSMGDTRMKSHILNVSRAVEKVGTVSAYVYRLDYDSVDALSSQSYGLRLVGGADVNVASHDGRILWQGEIAHQDDVGDNPFDVSETYYHVMLGAKAHDATLKVGFESLGGNGKVGESYQTPLATLHAFNGWADQFLTTPPGGLEDMYVSLGYVWQQLNMMAVYHDFSSDKGSMDYGTEWDLMATYPICEAVDVGVKYAAFNADDYPADVDKFWLWVQWQVKLAVNRTEES